jgi:hypothetical protein
MGDFKYYLSRQVKFEKKKKIFETISKKTCGG